MTINEYQKSALRTYPKPDWGDPVDTGENRLLNGLMGLNGEAGECIDILKKHMF